MQTTPVMMDNNIPNHPKPKEYPYLMVNNQCTRGMSCVAMNKVNENSADNATRKIKISIKNTITNITNGILGTLI